MEELFTLLAGGSMLVTVLAVACACVFPVVIVGAVMLFLLYSGKQAKSLEQAAQTWPSTTGQVIKSRVEVRGGEYSSVSPVVAYQYEVGGISYQNDTISVAVTVQQNAYDIVERYPVGATVTVYYDPANPKQSALER